MTTIHVVKLVVETISPLAINSGKRETNFDTALARDVNGLPYIPATAIAGIWGHLTTQYFGASCQRFWFGAAAKRDQKKCDAERFSSRFTISNGYLHDQNNQPVSGFVDAQSIEQDVVLKQCILERPHHRERVAINDRGVAKEQQKFDQIVLPTGARFSITVRWESTENANPYEVLALWNLRQMAFGSSIRNGLGQIKLVCSEEQVFELSQGAEVGAALSGYLHSKQPPQVNNLAQTDDVTSSLVAELPLQALDNWRCGSGTDLLSTNNVSEHKVNILTYSEPRWIWGNGEVCWQKAVPVLCGSSIKGILAHRVAYHYRKHAKIWAEEMVENSHKEWQARPKEIELLFGHADEDSHLASYAGQLIVDDCQLDYEHVVVRHHNAIDRFTGGVRKGALYSEELLYQPKFTIKIWCNALPCHIEKSSENQPLISALKDTLKDIELGLLPIGAGSGRGNSLVVRDCEKEWKVNLAPVEKIFEEVC